MTSQQSVGVVVRADEAPREQSYLNFENVLGSFEYPIHPTDKDFAPRWTTATVADPQTGLPQHWLALQFASRRDGAGMAAVGRPPLRLMLVIDISGSMSWQLEGDDEGGPRVSKLEVAKQCADAILAQCGDADEVGVMLFNHETHLLQAPIACTAANRKKLSAKLKAVTPGGGTRLEQAFCAGFKALEKASGASKALKAGAKKAIGSTAGAKGAGKKAKGGAACGKQLAAAAAAVAVAGRRRRRSAGALPHRHGPLR